MQEIRVELGERSYDILIDSCTINEIGRVLKEFQFSRLALVSNPTVYGLYGPAFSTALKDAGFDVIEILIPDGEEYKSLESLEHIYTGLLKAKLDRKSALIALGGGVIGDITGYAASTYMRGIDFIQAPTTLLAQVDSSVGGKTGVNHPLGKNMIGTFWQPRLVWIDTETLKTLPRREFLSGMAEVIKYGVIWDAELFEFLMKNRTGIMSLDRECLIHIIRRSCEIKAEVVASDERESGLRAILNYGHTIGHAIETVTGYTKYLHGEALAIGMYIEARIAQMLGVIDQKQVSDIREMILSYDLPADMTEGLDFNSIMSSMQLDKKAVAGELKFILPERIGSVRIQKGVPSEKIKEACLL